MAVSDDTNRTQGREAQRQNIAIVRSLANDVRTTLGPKGMDKMIVDGLGDIIVTNDGYTLLTEMRIKHPAAKLAIEAAIAQQNRVGDGTTTVIVVAGEILAKAQALLDLNIHPAVIGKGFRSAEKIVGEFLDELVETIDLNDESIILSVAQTAMTGKGAETSREHLARLVLDALRLVGKTSHDKFVIDHSGLKLERMAGGQLSESELVRGVVLSREPAHPHMPNLVTDAKVAIIEQAIEIKNPELTTQIQIRNPEEMQAYIEQEHKTLAAMALRLVKSGCNVLLCQQNIEEPADYYLNKAGVLAVRRVPQSDLVRIGKATGARIVSSPDILEDSDIGIAGRVRVEANDRGGLIYIENCPDPKAATLIIKAGTEHAAEEACRAVEDALGDIASVLRTKHVVGGAGAIEIQLSRRLRERAKSEKGKDRLMLEAFADALLVIPRTLIESSGEDPIEVIAEIEVRQEGGQKWAGYNVSTGEIMDSWEAGILEPLEIKTQAIRSAMDVASMILRIDDILIGESHDKG